MDEEETDRASRDEMAQPDDVRKMGASGAGEVGKGQLVGEWGAVKKAKATRPEDRKTGRREAIEARWQCKRNENGWKTYQPRVVSIVFVMGNLEAIEVRTGGRGDRRYQVEIRGVWEGI